MGSVSSPKKFKASGVSGLGRSGFPGCRDGSESARDRTPNTPECLWRSPLHFSPLARAVPTLGSSARRHKFMICNQFTFAAEAGWKLSPDLVQNNY